LAGAKPDPQPAKAPESGSAAAAEPRVQPADETFPRDAAKHREVAQVSPTTPAETPVAANRARATTPGVEARPAETPAGPKVAATPGEKTRELTDLDAKISTRPAERMPGQVAGPVGGQFAVGVFNPPTAPPAPTSAPAATWQQQQQVVQAPPTPTSAPADIRALERAGQQDQIVQVRVVRQSPLTQSVGDAVAVRLACPPAQPGRGNQVEQNLATANVLKLVITLNYRQPGEAGGNPDLDRATRLGSAAASQAAPAHDAPAADKAAQEEAKQESRTQSK